MIDPKLFTVESLLAELLDDMSGNRNQWMKHATIIPGYMPPHPHVTTRPSTVVLWECGVARAFLRYSKGPGSGYFWDIYGDDFLSPELALKALLEAPVPPQALRPEVWYQPK